MILSPIDGGDPEGREDFVNKSFTIDLENMAPQGLSKISRTFRNAVSVLHLKLKEYESEIERLKARIEELEKRAAPDYIPLPYRIAAWVDRNEIEKNQISAQLENEKIITQGKIVKELAETLKENQYGPHAITSMIKALSKGESAAGAKVLVGQNLDQREERLRELGFSWPTKNKPSKLSTKIQHMDEWEKDYEEGKAKGLSYLTGLSPLRGAYLAAAVGLLEQELGAITQPMNPHNKYQRLIKAYKPAVKALPPSQTPSSHPEMLCMELFGELIPSVCQAYKERIEKYGGLKLTPLAAIRDFCNLKLLPEKGVIWDSSHPTPYLRLKAIKAGFYDDQYSLVVKKVVEGYV